MNAYINVKNFGPIEKTEIDLRPLAVFTCSQSIIVVKWVLLLVHNTGDAYAV